MAEGSSHDILWQLREGGKHDREFGAALAVLIYMRWADFQESEQEAIAAFDGSEYKSALSPSLHWRTWCNFRDVELSHFLKERLPSALKGLHNDRQNPLATYLYRLAEPLQVLSRFTPEELKIMVLWLSEQPFETPSDRRQLLNFFDDFLNATTNRPSGDYRTPPAIADLMVELASPSFGNRVYDPCFGFGGLLTAACDYVRHKDIERFSRSGSPALYISGIERNSTAYLIGLVRLTLAGIDDPQLELGNALERPSSTLPQRDGFDVILANLPFGLRADLAGLDHFAVRTNDAAGLFIQHALSHLRPNGRAVLIVPQGFLFRGGPEQRLRRLLLEQHTVEAVVSLPHGVFLPYTGIQAAVLVLQRNGPTKSIRMLDAEPFFEKGKGNLPAKIRQDRVEDLAKQLRNPQPEKHFWDVNPETLAEVDWDFTPKRRDQSGLMGILDSLRTEIEIVSLSQCCTITSGRAFPRDRLLDAPPFRARLPKQEMLFSEAERIRQLSIFDLPVVPYVRIKDIQRGQASGGSSWLSPNAAASADVRWKLKAGDVLLSKSGTIGKAGVVRNGAVGAIPAAGLFVLRPEQDRLDPHFLLAYMNSAECRVWLDEKARGASIRHLSIRVVEELPVPLPPLQVQQRVAAEHREHGVDALAFLVKLLTEGEDDPIAKWIVDARQHLNSERYKDVFKDNEIRGMLHGACLGGAFTGVWHWAKEKEAQNNPLTPWVMALMESVNSLSHGDDIPPGPAYYSLLQQAESNLRRTEGAITGNTPNEIRARDLTRAIRDRVDQAMEVLAGDVRIIVSSDLNTLRNDSPANINLTLTNQGSLPLRDFRISTTPDWGQFQIGYIAEGASKTVSISGITPKGERGFSLRVEWKGFRLDGQQAQGYREISFDLIESAGADRVEMEVIGGSPYVCGDPVDPERSDVFFGREELLEQIRRQIIQSGNVVLLEGNRRSGKSSILKHLEGLEAVPGWIGVYCSFQGAKGSEKSTGVPTAEVFRLIAESVSKTIYKHVDKKIPLPNDELPPQATKLTIDDRKRFGIAVRESIGEEAPFSDFCNYIEVVMEALSERKLGLLLMLDEFDKLQEGIDNKVTSPQVPENIRYLIQSFQHISAILTGSRRLKRLREEYWSMLFGLGTRFSVTALSETSARLLITEPVKKQLVYDLEAISRAIHFTACQPYLLQCLCSRVFDMAVQLKTRSVTMDLVNNAGAALVADNEHFATMWDYIKSDRRRFILSLCHKDMSGPDPLRLGVIQERLIHYGIEVNDETLIADLEFLRELELVELVGEPGGGHYVLSIPLMGTWIEKQQDFSALLSKARLETEDQHD